MEDWREIPSFPGYYANSHGQILGRRGWILSSAIQSRTGYEVVRICYNYNGAIKKVHKLVAEAFLGHPPDGYEVNHKNGIRSDNRLENLEYVTRSQNILHGYYANGRVAPHSRITQFVADEIRELWRQGVKQEDLARRYGFNQCNISRICNYKRWRKEVNYRAFEK